MEHRNGKRRSSESPRGTHRDADHTLAVTREEFSYITLMRHVDVESISAQDTTSFMCNVPLYSFSQSNVSQLHISFELQSHV